MAQCLLPHTTQNNACSLTAQLLLAAELSTLLVQASLAGDSARLTAHPSHAPFCQPLCVAMPCASCVSVRDTCYTAPVPTSIPLYSSHQAAGIQDLCAGLPCQQVVSCMQGRLTFAHLTASADAGRRWHHQPAPAGPSLGDVSLAHNTPIQLLSRRCSAASASATVSGGCDVLVVTDLPSLMMLKVMVLHLNRTSKQASTPSL